MTESGSTEMKHRFVMLGMDLGAEPTPSGVVLGNAIKREAVGDSKRL